MDQESRYPSRYVIAGGALVALAAGAYWLHRRAPAVVDPNHLSILFMDDHYVAIHKPNGMKVHANSPDDPRHLVAMKMLKDQLAGVMLHCVHRIDMPTSGVLVFAFDKDAGARLMTEFQQKRVEKRYLAVCLTTEDTRYKAGDCFECNEPIASPKKKHKGKLLESHTSLRVLSVGEPFTVVECMPTTGRHHQIRIHLESLKLPIFGDYLHGDVERNNALGASRMFLEAAQLSFIHPYTNTHVSIKSPENGDLAAYL